MGGSQGDWRVEKKEAFEMTNLPVAVIGDPAKRTNLGVWEWAKQSKILAVGWLAMRVWLGIMWIEAGSSKLFGAESAGFLHNNCAGVAGFAAHGTPAYSWWGSFLHSFVVPNAGWIGVLIAVAEFTIGVALVAGLFTRIAALGSLALLFTYVMSGTASVCAWYALFAIVILTMWRTSSWIGIDGLIASYRERHHHERGLHTPIRQLLSQVSAGSPTVDKTA
jgi:thiosulfate dehydrogenase (quinone) large subunit